MDVFIDPRLEPAYARHPLVLVDAGARGGLRDNWAGARRHLRLIGFEPDKREYAELAKQVAGDDRTIFFDVALHNTSGPLRLHIARDRGLSSIFEPDRRFLDAFPEADRFDTIEIAEIEAETLDNLLRTRGIDDVDFLKVDTQGSELFVLQGAARALESLAVGIEVEVEFTPIYQGQPLFADVDRYASSLGYQLFDVRPCYWKRAAGRGIGGPRGQIIWADALYLKGVPALRRTLAALEPDRRTAKLLKAISVAVLYGYYDYALEILHECGEDLADSDRALIARRLGTAGASGVFHRLPGRRRLASAFHRLWQLSVARDDAWSVSKARLGNFGRQL